jgi:hypothetical protein
MVIGMPHYAAQARCWRVFLFATTKRYSSELKVDELCITIIKCKKK